MRSRNLFRRDPSVVALFPQEMIEAATPVFEDQVRFERMLAGGSGPGAHLPQLHRWLTRSERQTAPLWTLQSGWRQVELAERARAELYRRFAGLFERFDLIVTPGANTPAFDVNLRHPKTIDGIELEHYLGASLLTSAVTLSASPALSLPCGFDRWERPVGLQLVGRPRGEAALLAAGALFEEAAGLAALVPIEPREGIVPPDTAK